MIGPMSRGQADPGHFELPGAGHGPGVAHPEGLIAEDLVPGRPHQGHRAPIPGHKAIIAALPEGFQGFLVEPQGRFRDGGGQPPDEPPGVPLAMLSEKGGIGIRSQPQHQGLAPLPGQAPAASA